jgi:Tfp pilus assembly protein PilF
VQRALDLDADSFPANAMMIALELKEKRAVDARARIATMKRAHADDARVPLLEGEVNLALRDLPAAERAYVASYRLSPSSAAAMGVYRARSLARQPGATALLAEWLTREPRDLGARMILAQGLLEQKQHTLAIAQYELIVAGGQADATVLNNLAWLYSQKRDPRALEIAKKAYELAPKSQAVADTYGWILVENNRAAEALPILKGAAASPGAPADVRYHLAVAQARSGEREEARAALRKLAAEPGFEGAAEARKLLAETGG